MGYSLNNFICAVNSAIKRMKTHDITTHVLSLFIYVSMSSMFFLLTMTNSFKHTIANLVITKIGITSDKLNNT